MNAPDEANDDHDEDEDGVCTDCASHALIEVIAEQIGATRPEDIIEILGKAAAKVAMNIEHQDGPPSYFWLGQMCSDFIDERDSIFLAMAEQRDQVEQKISEASNAEGSDALN